MPIVERRTGRVLEPPVAAAGVFRWLFGGRLGRGVGRAIFESRALHAAVGRYGDSRLSRRHIEPLARRFGVDLGEAIVPEGGFASFNDFFTRRLRPGARPIDADPAALVSPADARLTLLPCVEPDTPLAVKGSVFTLARLLADEPLARSFEGGSAAVFRLYLPDCHRLVFPCEGVPRAPRQIAGHYYALTPHPGNDADALTRNVRTLTRLDTARFGALLLVDVGGFLIGSIRHTFVPDREVRRGDEKGCFAFGGSTLVLIARRGRVRWDEDLVRHAAAGDEVDVRIGERLGLAGEPSRPSG